MVTASLVSPRASVVDVEEGRRRDGVEAVIHDPEVQTRECRCLLTRARVGEEGMRQSTLANCMRPACSPDDTPSRVNASQVRITLAEDRQTQLRKEDMFGGTKFRSRDAGETREQEGETKSTREQRRRSCRHGIRGNTHDHPAFHGVEVGLLDVRHDRQLLSDRERLARVRRAILLQILLPLSSSLPARLSTAVHGTRAECTSPPA